MVHQVLNSNVSQAWAQEVNKGLSPYKPQQQGRSSEVGSEKIPHFATIFLFQEKNMLFVLHARREHQPVTWVGHIPTTGPEHLGSEKPRLSSQSCQPGLSHIQGLVIFQTRPGTCGAENSSKESHHPSLPHPRQSHTHSQSHPSHPKPNLDPRDSYCVQKPTYPSPICQ